MDIKELEKMIRKFVVTQSPNHTHTLSAFYDFVKAEAVKETKTVDNLKDPAPMIGLNPFRNEEVEVVSFDDHLSIVPSSSADRKLNRLLNYRVNEYEPMCD